jgi:hypothetical protein
VLKVLVVQFVFGVFDDQLSQLVRELPADEITMFARHAGRIFEERASRDIKRLWALGAIGTRMVAESDRTLPAVDCTFSTGAVSTFSTLSTSTVSTLSTFSTLSTSRISP